jgi:hypothetical protein
MQRLISIPSPRYSYMRIYLKLFICSLPPHPCYIPIHRNFRVVSRSLAQNWATIFFYFFISTSSIIRIKAFEIQYKSQIFPEILAFCLY